MKKYAPPGWKDPTPTKTLTNPRRTVVWRPAPGSAKCLLAPEDKGLLNVIDYHDQHIKGGHQCPPLKHVLDTEYVV